MPFLLQVGDYVFAKIMSSKGFDFYVPAIVIALPNHSVASEKFYTVLKCNNRRVSGHPEKGFPTGQKIAGADGGSTAVCSPTRECLGVWILLVLRAHVLFVSMWESLGFPCQTAVDGQTGSLWAQSLSLSSPPPSSSPSLCVICMCLDACPDV